MAEDKKMASWPKLCDCPLQAKALATMVILMMALGLFFSIGQVIVHDIIPTMQSEKMDMEMGAGEEGKPVPGRGDLFADAPVEEAASPFYQTDEFIFALKFTHIHLFGMGLIFIFMGMVALFIDVSHKAHAWLIVLPFVGVVIDLAGVWLKVFVSPVFFWLHVVGMGLFGTVFIIVSVLALKQMWLPAPAAAEEG
jgi:hypothetical protein